MSHANVEPVPMPSPEHGRVIPLEALRPKSDRERQLLKLDALAGHWHKFDPSQLRRMQQIAGVLNRQGGTLEGSNLDALKLLYSEFCGGEA